MYHPDLQPGNGDKKQFKTKSNEVIEVVKPTEGSTVSPILEQFKNHSEMWGVNMMDDSTIDPVSAGRKQHLSAPLSQGCYLQGMDDKQLLSLLEKYHDLFFGGRGKD